MLDAETIERGAKALFDFEQNIRQDDGWFNRVMYGRAEVSWEYVVAECMPSAGEIYRQLARAVLTAASEQRA